MTEHISLTRGIPEVDSTLRLLNEAYGDWGDESILHWKYEQYPGYKKEHTFAVTVDGELAAFRRMFDKEILANSRPSYRFFVLGDTCVALNHRGEGLYSKLHSETTTFCKRQERDFSCTFNRVGNITYKANLDRGWRYRTLPVNLRILSPEAVLPQYVQLAIDENGTIATILERIGGRIGIAIGGERIQADEFVHENGSEDPYTLYVPLPERLLAPLVEIGSSTAPVQAIRRRITREKTTESSAEINTRTEAPPFDEAFIDLIDDLYDSVTENYDLYFRRDRTDIEHMLSHPSLESVVVAEDDSEPVGVAPICLDTDEEVLEAQVLDIVSQNQAGFTALIERIESLAKDRDADLIVTITDGDPGHKWARIDRQVMMWDEYDVDTSPLADGSLLVGLYDVV